MRTTFINLLFQQQKKLLKTGIQQSCKNSVSTGTDVFAKWTIKFAFLNVHWDFFFFQINAISLETYFPLCPYVFSCLHKLLEAN